MFYEFIKEQSNVASKKNLS